MGGTLLGFPLRTLRNAQSQEVQQAPQADRGQVPPHGAGAPADRTPAMARRYEPGYRDLREKDHEVGEGEPEVNG